MELRKGVTSSRLSKSRGFIYFSLDKNDLYYLVGLIAADGCLFQGRYVSITSKYQGFLERIKEVCGIRSNVHSFRDGERSYYRIIIGSKSFYNWLVSIGMMEKKSKVIGDLIVPDEFISPFLRGVFDGDGCISVSHQKGYTKWSATFCTSSGNFARYLFRNLRRFGFSFKEYSRGFQMSIYLRIRLKRFFEFLYEKGGLFLDFKKNRVEVFYSSLPDKYQFL